MKRVLTLAGKLLLAVTTVGSLFYLIWFPLTEGRAINLDFISIYTDPVIVYLYVASLPFFVALHQGFKLLGYFDKGTIFAQETINTIKTKKFCFIALSAFLIGAEAYLAMIMKTKTEDSAGPMALGFILILVSVALGAGSFVAQRQLQHAVDRKPRN